MIDVEPQIVESLDRLVPAPGRDGLDWGEIERRARRGSSTPQRRRLLLVAAALALVVVAAAVARSLGGFSGWLTGQPGKPASQAQQQAFERATGSWAGFPRGTQLRSLEETTVDGATYDLNGFRGAGALCLRLVVSGGETANELACPPLSQLQRSSEPAIVVVAGYGVGRGTPTPGSLPFPFGEPTPAALVTLGIVADGVGQVEVGYSDGTTQQALVQSDSFLAVKDSPRTDDQVTHVWAVSAGKRVEIPFVVPVTPLSWPPATPTNSAHGPSGVQRRLHGGTIHWLAHRLPVGVPVPKTVHDIVGAGKSVIYAREITPDPGAPERMVVSLVPTPPGAYGGHLRDRREVCGEIVGGRYRGGGCWPADRLFATEQFSWSASTDRSDQYVTLAGLASDQVSRLELYLGNGQSERVPLHDNGYLVETPAVDYPLRLVAYDGRGLVIGIATLRGDARPPGTPTPARPVPNARWRTILRNGAGTVSVAPSTGGGRCYAIEYGPHASGVGGGSLSCPAAIAPTAMNLGLAWSPRGPTTADIRAGSRIATVVLHFADGRREPVRIVDGTGLAVIPARDVVSGKPFRGVIVLTGLDAAGHAIATQNVLSLIGGAGAITAIKPDAITIGPARCELTSASPPLTGFRPGDRVQYLCHAGALLLIAHTPAGRGPAARTTLIRGPIVRLSTDSIAIADTIRPARRTCRIGSTSPPTRGYKQGEQVLAYCAGGDLTGLNHAS